MSKSRERSERRGATTIVASALVVIASGTSWEHARRDTKAALRLDSARGDVVLARVPARRGDASAAEREVLRAGLVTAPRDLAQSVRLARLDIATARERADPRYLGRAEGVLGPWWDLADPPSEVLLLRATIRQSRHEFDAALIDLERLTVVSPDDPQAWLTRAVVLGVKGRYAEALASCQRLDGMASPFVRAACRAPVWGVTGHTSEAATALAAALDGTRTLPEAAWARSLLAELALWSGDQRGPEALLRALLSLAPTDGQARAALADLLLDQGRGDEVAALVAGHEDDDGLLLRKALARLRGGTARALSASDASVVQMAARFEASRLRGDTVHQREEARFALAVDSEPGRALGLAQRNWQVQREPADARVLIEAALAAHDPAAAAPALAWMAQTGIEWPRLRALAAELRGAS